MNRLLLTIILLTTTAGAATLDDQIRAAYPTATNGVNYTLNCSWLGTPQDGCAIASWDTNSLGQQPALTNLPSLATAGSILATNKFNAIQIDDCLGDANCARRFMRVDYPSLLVSTTNAPTVLQMRNAVQSAWKATH